MTQVRYNFLKYVKQFTFLLMFLWISPAASLAQTLPTETAQEDAPQEPQWPKDELGRRTPRGAVAGFLSSVAEKNFEKAGRYFAHKNIRANPEQLARNLQILLNKGGHITPSSLLSSDFEGNLDDDLAANLERVGTISAENETFDLILQKNEDSQGAPVWLISEETSVMLRDFGELEESPLLVDRLLPAYLENTEWSGVPVGQWLILLANAIVVYGLVWLFINLILFLIPLVWKKAKTEPTSGIIKAFSLPVKLYMAVLLFVTVNQELGISIILRQRISGITIIVGLLAFLILLWQLSEFIGNFSQRRMSARGNISGVSVVLFLKRAAKIAIVVFGIIAALGAIGVDVTTGLAALGIGGLALALGAQKTIENFVGSVTLITDQPVRVGDFCTVEGTTGTVEKIGMRSTRIRTLNRTVITIPNGAFSSSKIENYAPRDRFLFNPQLKLRYETTPNQIRYLLVEIRAILYGHPMVTSETARVRFVELAQDSINLEIFTYIKATNFDEYLEVKEDLLLRVMDIIGGSGTGFAFPSQTIYFGKDMEISKEKSQTAEERVKTWQQKGELQIPKFDPEKIKEIENTLPYPPEGSAERKQTGNDLK